MFAVLEDLSAHLDVQVDPVYKAFDVGVRFFVC